MATSYKPQAVELKPQAWQENIIVVWDIIGERHMKNKTIRIIVKGGVVVDVENIPDGYEVQIVDNDES